MPYGVTSFIYSHIPSDDQAAVRAGWIGAGGNADGSGVAGGINADGSLVPAPPPPPPPSPGPPPPAPDTFATDALAQPGTNVPEGLYGQNVTVIPAPTVVGYVPPAPPPSTAPAGGVLEEFMVEESDRVDPGAADAKLPAGAWADLREFLVKDQPFLGVHARNRGRGLRNVVASDLWTST